MKTGSIIFKGAVYVESAHKKCKKGTHWNVVHNKCMELSSSLGYLHANANSWSHKAKKEPTRKHHEILTLRIGRPTIRCVHKDSSL